MNNDPRPLPPGWVMQWDPNYQRYYFVDPVTKQSTWTDPRGPLPAVMPGYGAPPAYAPTPTPQQYMPTSGYGTSSYGGMPQHMAQPVVVERPLMGGGGGMGLMGMGAAGLGAAGLMSMMHHKPHKKYNKYNKFYGGGMMGPAMGMGMGMGGMGLMRYGRKWKGMKGMKFKGMKFKGFKGWK
ncbi:hypothetical protein HDU85_006813 [Gaertneriomyces sp. JEL0708]|nr:hypothetical protein HDU85_006813 [Gaertneriomyces sp. JEL0708]